MSNGVSFKLNVPPSAAAPKAAPQVASQAASVAAPPAALKATCKHGDKCHGCRVCCKGGKGGGAQVTQLASDVKNLKAELAGIKAAHSL